MFKIEITTAAAHRTPTLAFHADLGFAMDHVAKLVADHAAGDATLVEVIVYNTEGEEVHAWEAE